MVRYFLCISRILREISKYAVADKFVSRKIDFSSFGRRPSVRKIRRLCLRNNSIEGLRCRWNPLTLSLATHDGWRSVNATPRMAGTVKQVLFCVFQRQREPR